MLVELNPLVVYGLIVLNGLLTGLGSFLGQLVGKRVYTNIKRVIKKNGRSKQKSNKK